MLRFKKDPPIPRSCGLIRIISPIFLEADLQGFRIATPKVEPDPASAVMPPYLGRNRYQQMMGS